AGMIIIDHPFPLQPPARVTGIVHPLEHPAEILGLVVPPIGDVSQPRRRSGPAPQHLFKQRRDLPRQRPLARLGHPPQVDGPQPLPPPVVHRNRRRGPFPVSPLAADREHPSAAPHSHDRLPATSGPPRPLQPPPQLHLVH